MSAAAIRKMYCGGRYATEAAVSRDKFVSLVRRTPALGAANPYPPANVRQVSELWICVPSAARQISSAVTSRSPRPRLGGDPAAGVIDDDVVGLVADALGRFWLSEVADSRRCTRREVEGASTAGVRSAGRRRRGGRRRNGEGNGGSPGVRSDPEAASSSRPWRRRVPRSGAPWRATVDAVYQTDVPSRHHPSRGV
jgi:hypothetical protein